MFDPLKPAIELVHSEIDKVKTWAHNEDEKLGLDLQIAIFSKLAQFVESEVTKLKADRAKLN